MWDQKFRRKGPTRMLLQHQIFFWPLINPPPKLPSFYPAHKTLRKNIPCFFQPPSDSLLIFKIFPTHKPTKTHLDFYLALLEAARSLRQGCSFLSVRDLGWIAQEMNCLGRFPLGFLEMCGSSFSIFSIFFPKLKSGF